MNHNQHFFPEYVPYNENHNNIPYGRNKNNNVMINQHFNRQSHKLPWQGNPARSHQSYQKNHISVYWQNRHRQLYPNYDNHTNSTIQDQQNYRSNTKLPRKLSCQIKNQHKEKAKVEGSFHCQPCERNFLTGAALDAHKRTHIQCDEEGCSYVASSKAVKLHYVQTHAEGKFRINLQTLEDIQKWRDERRRNWPSLENITKKRQIEQENVKAGIKLETKEYVYREMEGKRRRRGQGQKNVIPEECRDGRIRNKNDNLRYRFNYNICEQVVATCRGLSSPNSNEAIYKSENISSERDFEKGLESNNRNDNVSTTGLRLLQSYQVDDDIFEEESSRTNDNVSIQVVALSDKALIPAQFALMVTKEKEEGELSDQPEEIQEEDSNTLKNHKLSSNFNRLERSSSTDGGKATFKTNKKCLSTDSQNNCRKQASLLEMLLAKEIRHERNIILQCIRYIVNKCFFEK